MNAIGAGLGGLAALIIGLMPPSARADLWVVESSLKTGVESNDNVALAPDSPGTVRSASLAVSVDASRQLENSVTRLKSDATALRQSGPGAFDRVDGQLALTQSFNDPLNTFTFAFQHSQDFNNTAGAADVTLGQGQRRATGLSGGWSRALSERLSASTQLASGRTAYGRQLAGAVDYRDASLSGGLSYALSEATSLGLQSSYSRYEPVDERNRSATYRLGLTLSGTFSEQAGGSLNIGAYQTHSSTPSPRLACPLQIAYCIAGIVPFVVVSEATASTSRGLEYGASYRRRFDETTDASLSVARQQVPSGVGALVRNDTLSAVLNHEFSETLGVVLSAARSRSVFPESANAARFGRTDFSLSLTKQLTPDLSLATRFQRVLSDAVAGGRGARSNGASVFLQYSGLRVDSSR